MSQANVSRAKAVRALKNNNNDIVNAIMVRFFFLIVNCLNYFLTNKQLCLFRFLVINVFGELFSDE